MPRRQGLAAALEPPLPLPPAPRDQAGALLLTVPPALLLGPSCSCRLPFCPMCLEADNYANSEYGPDAAEPTQPDIDAINRANMMNTTK